MERAGIRKMKMRKTGNKKMIRTFCILFCIFAWSPILFADVYSLWPFSAQDLKNAEKKENGEKKTLPPGVLPVQPKNFWQEDVIVNGNKLRLNIYLLEGKWEEIAAYARQNAVKGSALMGNSNSLYIQNPVKNGMILRTYYLHLSDTYPMLMFQMSLPQNRLKMARNLWPQELPLLSNAENLNCMQFPARDALYGSYDVADKSVSQVLSTISANAAAAGWAPVSGETKQLYEGAGEVFHKEDPSRVLILGLQELPGGKGTRITLYTRKL